MDIGRSSERDREKLGERAILVFELLRIKCEYNENNFMASEVFHFRVPLFFYAHTNIMILGNSMFVG